jgi:hypothetical protein
MKIITYPDGRSEQVGTPLELAQFMLGLIEYQTMQKFKNLIDSIPQQIESPNKNAHLKRKQANLMQTDRGIYHKRVCDRCGYNLEYYTYDEDELLKGWGWRRDTGDLCPECYEEYKRVIARFNANRKRGER